MSDLKLTQLKQTVAVTGTAVPLSSTSLKVQSLIIIADSSNTGTIYIGDSAVDAPTRLGIPLVASQDVTVDPTEYFGTDELIDLKNIYMDSSASGDSVNVSYYTREVN